MMSKPFRKFETTSIFFRAADHASNRTHFILFSQRQQYLSHPLNTIQYSLYSNSTSSYRPIVQLIHDIELNPGPDYSVNDSLKRAKSNVTIPHLNVRSLKYRDHFLLVKESILANKIDVFTISESWLDSSVTDLELEVPDYNLHRIDRQNKKGGGVCVYV